MPDYDLSLEAEEDLRKIARYTLSKWGVEQTRRYEAALTKCFDSIAQGKVVPRRLNRNRSDLLYVNCEHHYVFYCQRHDVRPLIIAIFHERMDLISRLSNRLIREE